ncbi:MAG: PPC domain-containing DNA-binding protein [Kiritimatiellia bacterium]
MKYSEAKQGRVFVLRLEDGEVLHTTVEGFARELAIKAAALIVLGGADKGSKLVVGPQQGRSTPVVPMEQVLGDVGEIAGVGTLFPDARGNPVLHMHIACGRGDATITGCVRRGVLAWHVMEIVIWEMLDTTGRRLPDVATGFELLNP